MFFTVTTRDWVTVVKKMRIMIPIRCFLFLKETYRIFHFSVFLDCLTHFILDLIKSLYVLGVLTKNVGHPDGTSVFLGCSQKHPYSNLNHVRGKKDSLVSINI